jgi:hypothetical protein
MNKKLMLVILLLLAFILNVSIVNAWWSVGGSWGYRKQVTITSSSALTNYQVRIPFASLGVSGLVSGGKMKSDYSDARFLASDDATALDYWVDAELSEFWVEVADVVNGSTLIYFYYGNPSATAGSNGDNTFQLYDNFTGTSLDTNKWQTWQVGTGTKDLQVGSDRLLVTARGTEWTCSGIYTKTAVSYTSLVIEVKNKWNLSTSSDTSKEVRITRDASLPTAQDTGNQYRFDYYKLNTTSHHYRILKDVTGTGSVVTQVDLTNNNPANYEWERYVCYNGNQKGYRSTDGATFNATWTATDTSHPLPNSLFIGYSVSEGRNSVASTAELDWIRVRKYNATEPSIGTVGSEEQGFGTSPTKLKLDSATSSSVVADGTSTSLITMGIYDNGDLVVSSASNSITFTISGQGTLVAPTAKNATSGKATIMFQSGTTTGAAVVSATSSNLAMATAGLTLTAGAPAKLVNTAQPISIVANASSTSVITARVTDANNNPVTTVSSGWSGGLTGANGGKWSYRKPVTIASSSVQSAYQVRVLFTDVGLSALVSAGKVQSDYDDIRFSTSSVPTS